MKYENLPRWFKSEPAPLQLKADQIDKENEILHGVILAQVGEAKGHGVHLEQEFVDTIVSYGKEHYAEIGLKCRLSHPGMSNTAMGTQLGKFKNFRVDGDKAIADLHFIKAANNSPTHPKMQDWVFEMAENDPDFIMNSIVFSIGEYYQYDDNDDRVDAWKKDKNGDYETDAHGWRILQFDDREVFVTMGVLHYSDLVEQGAATDTLFSAQFNQDKFAIQAVEFVKEHPALHKFLKANPTKLIDFAKQVGIELPKPSFSEKLNSFKTFLFGETKEGEESPADMLAKAQGQFDSDLEKFKIELSEKHENEMEALKKISEKKEAASKKQLTELQTEMTTLKERVPNDPTDVDPAPDDGNKKEEFTSSATQKASEAYEKRKARIAAREKK